jgi:hypothetical protein
MNPASRVPASGQFFSAFWRNEVNLPSLASSKQQEDIQTAGEEGRQGVNPAKGEA